MPDFSNPPRLLLAAALLAVALLSPHKPATAAPSMLELHFLDIGQGDGILLRTPSGRNIMIDTGISRRANWMIRYLKRIGVKRINLLLITHPHLDHFGGFQKLAAAIPIRKYIDPGFPYSSPSYKKVLRTLKRKRIRTFTGRIGQILDLGGGAVLRVLAPAKPFIEYSRSDANANSMVVRLEYKNLRVLLTGDAEAETEHRLLKRPHTLRANVLKVAHHGSRYASSRNFLRTVGAKVAIISCGRKNRYGHPHKATLGRLQQANLRTYITARHGTIILRSNGKKIWLSTRKNGQQRTVLSLALPRKLNTIQPLASQDKPAQSSRIRHTKWLSIRPQGREVSIHHITPSKQGYVASRRSRVFHRRSCRFAKLIKPKNRLYFRHRKQALRKRRPASDCNP